MRPEALPRSASALQLLLCLVTVVTGAGQSELRAQGTDPSRRLVGHVFGPDGQPFPGARVSVTGLVREDRSDEAGRFSLEVGTRGAYVILIRAIGFQSVEYRWQADSVMSAVTIHLQPLPRILTAAKVIAERTLRPRGSSSVSGTVTDSAGRPMARVEVRLLGAGLSTETDDAGQFAFAGLTAGTYLIRARNLGWRAATHAVQLADDDARGMSLKMFGLQARRGGNDLASRSGYGVADLPFTAFDTRARVGTGRTVLGPGDLFRANGEALDRALIRAWASPLPPIGRLRDRNGSVDDFVCILLDGRMAVRQPLRSFSPQQAQAIELYAPSALVDEYLADRMRSLTQCVGARDRHPPYVVVWTRGI